MKNYKGTDRFMRCQDFQFELGKRFSLSSNIELKSCEAGFHSCNSLLEVTKYYPPADSRYFEVEIEDIIVTPNKNCSRHILFLRELTFNEVMRLLNFKEDGSPLGEEDNQSNLGFFNEGNYNRGNSNLGNSNLGNSNLGNYNRGNCNEGNCNEGNSNIGNSNLGNYNRGNSNIGNYNKSCY